LRMADRGRIQAKQSQIINSDFCRLQLHPDNYTTLMKNVSMSGFIDPLVLRPFSHMKTERRHTTKKYKKSNAEYLKFNYWDAKLLIGERTVESLLNSVTSETVGKIIDSIGFIGRETFLTEEYAVKIETLLHGYKSKNIDLSEHSLLSRNELIKRKFYHYLTLRYASMHAKLLTNIQNKNPKFVNKHRRQGKIWKSKLKALEKSMDELMFIVLNNELDMVIDFDNFMSMNPLFGDAITKNFDYSTVEERDKINNQIENEIISTFNILLSRLDQSKQEFNIIMVKSDVGGERANEIRTGIRFSFRSKNKSKKFKSL